MVDLIGNGRERRPLIRGHHGKLMRLAHLERDSPREDPAELDRFNDAAQRGDDPPLADELSQSAPCGALPAAGWPSEWARDAHRDVCADCADIEASEQILEEER